ncbi:ABC transporter permease [Arcanobacterium hippocoleae]|uniref:ABC-2 type transport system permease protein n=1 Tax=Arcanobacterium hippocoleae TaxID=149017 RepID=A0ABU1T386_9ACTO|nr:ABC transporter permease [Arcanobacterium hippocoleae]MDR6939849.1 ABC-2 type transport system permease protein [Arcanobacterium hippocoleae]
MLKHIIAREYKVLMRTKAQVISTLITILLILGGGFAGKYFLDQENDDATSQPDKAAIVKVALAPEMESFEKVLNDTGLIASEVIESQPDYGKWLTEIADREEDGVSLVLAGTLQEPKIIRYGENFIDSSAIKLIGQAVTFSQVQQIAGEITPQQAENLAAAMDIPVQTVTGSGNLMIENPVGYFTALVAQFLLFFAVTTSLSTLSVGIVEEKSSRVVEILLSAVRPRTLLLGKIIGIGLFALTQLVLYLVAIFVSLNIAGLWHGIEVGTILIWMIIWLLLGFFTFTTLAGGVSSMVSRQEDLGGIITPLMLLMIIPFYLGMFLVPAAPDSIWTKVFSTIPGFSSFIMPVRQAYESVEIWELVLAAGISFVSVPLFAAVAGRIYENSILRMGKRVTLRQALSGK